LSAARSPARDVACASGTQSESGAVGRVRARQQENLQAVFPFWTRPLVRLVITRATDNSLGPAAPPRITSPSPGETATQSPTKPGVLG